MELIPVTNVCEFHSRQRGWVSHTNMRDKVSKKGLKMPNGELEAVNKRTDNTMDKRNRTKGQTMIYSTLHRQLKIDKQEPHTNTGINSGRISSSSSGIVVLLLLP